MDYDKFYAEVAAWIKECNTYAVKYGLMSDEFWLWVTRSSGLICNKYDNNDLVKRQMLMLIDWLSYLYERGKAG